MAPPQQTSVRMRSVGDPDRQASWAARATSAAWATWVPERNASTTSSVRTQPKAMLNVSA
jgi:hypothetical protein